VLNALGLHAARATSSNHFLHLRVSIPVPHIAEPVPRVAIRVSFSVRKPPPPTEGNGGSASTPAVIVDRCLAGTLAHSVRAPFAFLRFCLSNISYIKAQPRSRAVLYRAPASILYRVFREMYHGSPRTTDAIPSRFFIPSREAPSLARMI